MSSHAKIRYFQCHTNAQLTECSESHRFSLQTTNWTKEGLRPPTHDGLKARGLTSEYGTTVVKYTTYKFFLQTRWYRKVVWNPFCWNAQETQNAAGLCFCGTADHLGSGNKEVVESSTSVENVVYIRTIREKSKPFLFCFPLEKLLFHFRESVSHCAQIRCTCVSNCDQNPLLERTVGSRLHQWEKCGSSLCVRSIFYFWGRREEERQSAVVGCWEEMNSGCGMTWNTLERFLKIYQ